MGYAQIQMSGPTVHSHTVVLSTLQRRYSKPQEWQTKQIDKFSSMKVLVLTFLTFAKFTPLITNDNIFF